MDHNLRDADAVAEAEPATSDATCHVQSRRLLMQSSAESSMLH